jgi:hypothetical protein
MKWLTIDASIVRLNMDGLDLAVLNLKSISLASWTPKNSSAIKS